MRFLAMIFLLITAADLIAPVRAQLIVDSDTAFLVDSRRPTSCDNSARIEALLRRMTVEEKVGQMNQTTVEPGEFTMMAGGLSGKFVLQ